MPYADPAVNRAYHAAYKRKWVRLHPEKAADSDRARHANRRARLYGSSERITIEDVRYAKRLGVCFYCGATEGKGAFRDLGIDHRVPLHAGGRNHRDNLVCCCHSCNASKFRGDRPGRWSRAHDQCIDCGTSERKHICHGRCNRCYMRNRK
jgi:hypothetical protein